MVTKLELALLVAITLFSFAWFQSSEQEKKKHATKKGMQMEFTNPHLIEIDSNGSKKVTTAKKMKRYSYKTDFTKFHHKSNEIELTSDFAREKKDNYYVWKSVVATKPNGSIYRGYKAIYRKKTDTLEFKKKFLLDDNITTVIGQKMYYDKNNSTIKGKKVKAVYDLPPVKNDK